MQRISLTHDYAAPVDQVYAYFAEHENLQEVFGAKVRRVREGHTTPNGVGSVRELKLGPLPPFQETITQAEPNELIEYRITKGTPLRDHVGVMRFSPQGSGTRLDYTIQLGAPVPGVARLVALALERGVARGLVKAERRLGRA